MNLSCTTKAIKYLMFSFNFIFVITGIILIAVGATIHSNYNKYDLFLDGKYFSLPNLLIATGILIFIIAFLGCYGALKESWVMLMAFSVLLGVIFVFEFSAGIAGYVLRDKTSAYLEEQFYDTMPKYTTNGSAVAEMWDIIQQEFHCCGVNGPEDWTVRLNHNASSDLPVSCCPSVSGIVGQFTCNNYKFTTIASTTVNSSVTTANSSSTTPAPLTTSLATTSPTSPSVPTTTNDTSGHSRKRRQAGSEQSTTALPDPSTSTPYQNGCESVFGSWVKDHAVDIGAVGFTLAVIQIAGIVFACHLSRQLKNRYYST